MFELINDFHWPTFFLTITFVIIGLNIWYFIVAKINQQVAQKQVDKVDKSLNQLLKKMGEENKKINEILGKNTPKK
ncbi:MAG: hypothetical protein KKF06_02600 [Candidatus Margulisbacteria bacterium]|nr:hypothetical protein [Candidatus Margulisiibacteriota bacterium]